MPSSYVSHMDWIYDKAKVIGRRQNGELVSRRKLAYQYDYVYRQLGPNGHDPYGPFTRDRLAYETERRLHDHYWGNVGPPFPGVRPDRPQPSRAVLFSMSEPPQARQASQAFQAYRPPQAPRASHAPRRPQASQAPRALYASQALQTPQAKQQQQRNTTGSSSSIPPRNASSYTPLPQTNDGTDSSSVFASNITSHDPRQATSASTYHT